MTFDTAAARTEMEQLAGDDCPWDLLGEALDEIDRLRSSSVGPAMIAVALNAVYDDERWHYDWQSCFFCGAGVAWPDGVPEGPIGADGPHDADCPFGMALAWRDNPGRVTFDDWVAEGRTRGFIVGEGFCASHDSAPVTDDEIAEAEKTGFDLLDICAPSFRVDPRT